MQLKTRRNSSKKAVITLFFHSIRILFIIGIGFEFFGSSLGFAAQVGRVQKETVLYEAPSRVSKEIEKLTKGTLLQVSNRAQKGFYKVRVFKKKELGWVLVEDVLLFQEKPQGPSEHRSWKQYEPWIFGGMGLYSPAQLESLVEAQVLHNPYHLGVAFTWWLRPSWGPFVRLDWFTKESLLTDASQNVFNLQLTSWVLSLGAVVQLWNHKPFCWDLQGGIGVGVQTQVVLTQVNASAPNESFLTSTAFSVFLSTKFSWFLKKYFFTSLEMGYRMLWTPDLVPSPSGNGSFLLKKNNEFFPVPIHLFGIFFSFGIGFLF